MRKCIPNRCPEADKPMTLEYFLLLAGLLLGSIHSRGNQHDNIGKHKATLDLQRVATRIFGDQRVQKQTQQAQ